MARPRSDGATLEGHEPAPASGRLRFLLRAAGVAGLAGLSLFGGLAATHGLRASEVATATSTSTAQADPPGSLRLDSRPSTTAAPSLEGWLMVGGAGLLPGGPGVDGVHILRASYAIPPAWEKPAPEPSKPRRTLPEKPPSPAQAEGDLVKHGVNFSNLISDAEFVDSGFMTVQEIQSFLEEQSSFLATHQENGRSAAQILADAAGTHGVNPMVLLSTLEKESSLVTLEGKAANWRLRSAMGYAYHDGGGRPGRSSFAWQVDRGAELLRELYEEGKQMSFPTIMKVDYGKAKVTVRNAATYALYRYTPHTVDTGLRVVGGGNYNFRNVYARFYGSYARLLEAGTLEGAPAQAVESRPPQGLGEVLRDSSYRRL